jgi:hypothetical protein
VHPAFVEILKQLTPAEAQLLTPLGSASAHPAIALGPVKEGSVLPGLVLTAVTPIGLDPEKLQTEMLGLQNLQRLGVVQFDFDHAFVNDSVYRAIKTGAAMTLLLERLAADNVPARDTPGMLRVTEFGEAFLRSCLGPRP